MNTYQDIFVKLSNHKNNPLLLQQLSVVHHAKTLRSIFLVRLVVDQAGEVSFLTQELNNKELVSLVSWKRKQEGVELFKTFLK